MEQFKLVTFLEMVSDDLNIYQILLCKADDKFELEAFDYNKYLKPFLFSIDCIEV